MKSLGSRHHINIYKQQHVIEGLGGEKEGGVLEGGWGVGRLRRRRRRRREVKSLGSRHHIYINSSMSSKGWEGRGREGCWKGGGGWGA